MNARTLILIGLGALVALALALLLVDRPGSSVEPDGEAELLPGLAERVNDIDALDIVAPDGETVATLRRERERWRLREKHDYEADFARIHELLRDLARARRVETRTDQPQWHARLGVASPGAEEGAGAAVRFPDSEVPGLVIGRRDPAGIGRYVRLVDSPQVWLTGQDLDLPTERIEWLERAIMGIPAEDIREVSVRHAGGDRVELRPGDAEGSVWVMLDPPADREVRQSWQLRQTANALASLNMNDVRPHEESLVPDDAVETVFRTRDGMVFVARTFADDQGNWVHFRVREGDNPEVAEDSGPDETDVQIDVVAVDGRLSPWQFALEPERFKRFRPSTEDLLVATGEADG